MCDSVRQKLGHNSVEVSETLALLAAKVTLDRRKRNHRSRMAGRNQRIPHRLTFDFCCRDMLTTYLYLEINAQYVPCSMKLEFKKTKPLIFPKFKIVNLLIFGSWIRFEILVYSFKFPAKIGTIY